MVDSKVDDCEECQLVSLSSIERMKLHTSGKRLIDGCVYLIPPPGAVIQQNVNF